VCTQYMYFLSLVILVMTLAITGRAIQITNHINGGLGTRDSIPVENQVIMSLSSEGDGGILPDEFINGLMEMVERDECELTFSSMTDSKVEVVLSLNCPGLRNKPGGGSSATTTKKPLPTLGNTVSYMKRHFYRVDHLEYMQRITRPKSSPSNGLWYGGSYDNLDAVIKEGAARRAASKKSGAEKTKPHTIVHGAYTEYPAPWGLDRIDSRFGPMDSVYNYDNQGDQVDVYVIDTGIRVSHQEFEGRATFLINTAGDSINTDCNGHGTHVSSLVGGRTYGAAKNASLWGVKVLDCSGNGDTFTITTGVMAVIEHAQTRVGRRQIASASLGGQFSISINNAFLSLLTAGILPVVAAGNEYSDACDYSPSVLGQSSGVVVVGASTAQDSRPPWSNYGPCVSISAPGAEIIGAYYTSDTATIILSGTSMATPFVSGVVALIINQNLTLSTAEVKALLLAWATPSIISGASSSGGGKNLVYSLIDVAMAVPTIVTPPPTFIPSVPDMSDSTGSSGRATPTLLLFCVITMIGIMFIYE
jgi:hypothetical protein